MKPYTTTGNNGNEEDLRSNWRGNRFYAGNKNYHRKVADRACKKQYRAQLKQSILKELED